MAGRPARCRADASSRMHMGHCASAAALLAAVVAATAGCAGKRPLTAAETFSQASEHFDTGAYEVAIDSYKELLDQHPFTEHAEEAEIKIAQAYYLMGRNAEAIAAFSDFERMHPTSPQIPLVNYYQGMAHLKQMRPIDRDQSASGQAHAYFRAVIDRYPGSSWAERAKLRLRECEEALAGHEFYVVGFYLRQKNLPAAEARLGHLLRSYAASDAAAEALLLFGDTYAALDLREPAALAYRALIAHHPDDPLSKQARGRLKELGSPAAGTGLTSRQADPLRQLIAERLTPTPPSATDGRAAGSAQSQEVSKDGRDAGALAPPAAVDAPTTY